MTRSVGCARLQACILGSLFLSAVIAYSQTAANSKSVAPSAVSAELAPGSAHLLMPEDLSKIIQSPAGTKPLVLMIGPHMLYQQAHIPASDYIGATSSSEGIEKLKERVKSLPKNQAIVLYCGCCPWIRCPNVRPAFSALHQLGYSNVKVLYIANNFGSDWVDKGYPTTEGE